MTRWGYFNLAQTWTLNHWTRVLSNPTFLESFVTTLKVGRMEVQIGIATYSHWKRLSIDLPTLDRSRPATDRTEKKVLLPDTYQPYVRVKANLES